jgi:AbrB family looped-hinge helix DNA binding protein
METTKLSSKGQIVLPRAVRTAKAWREGQQLVVEATPEGVLLRPLKPFAATRLEDVAGCAGYHGPRKSVDQMDAAVAALARRRK